MIRRHPTSPRRRLEGLMRDVLDGLEEFSLDTAYGHLDFQLEILSIDPPRQESAASGEDAHCAAILDFPTRRLAG